jgi:hypothetical protein
VNHALTLCGWFIAALEGALPTTSTITPAKAAKIIAERGWSYRALGKELGKNPGHIHQVVKGKRVSQPVLNRISKLPSRKGQLK